MSLNVPSSHVTISKEVINELLINQSAYSHRLSPAADCRLQYRGLARSAVVLWF